MTVHTPAMSMPVPSIPLVSNPFRREAVIASPREILCARNGRRYPTEFDCPCWTDLGTARAASLRSELESWYSGFVVRHPEFALA